MLAEPAMLVMFPKGNEVRLSDWQLGQRMGCSRLPWCAPRERQSSFALVICLALAADMYWPPFLVWLSSWMEA